MLNKVILVGKLIERPRMREDIADGFPPLFLRIAVKDIIQNLKGVERTKTDVLSLLAFGKTAQTCMRDLKEGDWIYCEGRLSVYEGRVDVICRLVLPFVGYKIMKSELEPMEERVTSCASRMYPENQSDGLSLD